MRTIRVSLFALAAVVTLFAAQKDEPSNHGCHSGQYAFKGTVRRGHTFTRQFGDFVFSLVPSEYGWSIDIAQGEQHYLANLTGPAHGPNAIYIEGWQFRNAANTGPNKGDVNEPQRLRQFLFSPRWPKCENTKGLGSDGQGTLEITHLELGNTNPGEKANILQMDFAVKLTVGRSACMPCTAAR